MATLDDKLLGEKLQNYCSSSSEDEADDKDSKSNDDDREKSKSIKGPKFIPEDEISSLDNWSGAAKNTGPKGVIKDWQRYKQLEHAKNSETKKERENLIKKLALTCRSDELNNDGDHKDGSGGRGGSTANGGSLASKAKMPGASNNNSEITMEELEKDLMEDEFFQEYLRKKLDEMKKKTISNLPIFGKVLELNHEMFLNEIDHENKKVTIIVHIYDTKMPECKIMNECLDSIATDYNMVKFCKIKSTDIDLSDKFRKMGCPALLIYKNAELIGNFVRMGDEFGSEFCASDVENFLIEQSFLPSDDLVKTAIREGEAMASNSD